MAAPRALVSRPLVKGNEESENEIGFLGADQKERGLWGRENRPMENLAMAFASAYNETFLERGISSNPSIASQLRRSINFLFDAPEQFTKSTLHRLGNKERLWSRFRHWIVTHVTCQVCVCLLLIINAFLVPKLLFTCHTLIFLVLSRAMH